MRSASAAKRARIALRPAHGTFTSARCHTARALAVKHEWGAAAGNNLPVVAGRRARPKRRSFYRRFTAGVGVTRDTGALLVEPSWNPYTCPTPVPCLPVFLDVVGAPFPGPGRAGGWVDPPPLDAFSLPPICWVSSNEHRWVNSRERQSLRCRLGARVGQPPGDDARPTTAAAGGELGLSTQTRPSDFLKAARRSASAFRVPHLRSSRS